MKKRKERQDSFLVFVFVLFISSLGFLTFFHGYRTIGGNALATYRETSGSVLANVKGFLTGVEAGFNEGFFGRSLFVDIHGSIQLILRKKLIDDVNPQHTVFKMDNGQLTFGYPEYDPFDFSNFVVEVRDYLSTSGTPLIYTQAPFKISKYEQDSIVSMVDSSNDNADRMMQRLYENNVLVVDLRDEIHMDETLYHQNAFYNTDHHWTTNASFWAYTKTIKFLVENTNVPVWNHTLTTDKSNYVVQVYPDSFLGSQGRRVGRFYGGVDDFELITPSFETDYEIEIVSHREDIIVKQGDFEESILDRSLLDGSSIATNRYATYFGGDYPLVKIKNKLNPTGKLLILQDSFGLPFSSFMSLNFAETQIIDLRHQANFDLARYLDDQMFDAVIMLYNPSVYREDTMELFNKNIIWSIDRGQAI